MNLKALRDKRARLLREAEGLRQADGTFVDDETRATFDAKMAEITEIDAKIRDLEAESHPAPSPSGAPDADAIRAEERSRITGIRRAVRVARLDERFADELVTEGVSLDQARAKILEKLESSQPAIASEGRIEPGEDEGEKWNRGVEAWLYRKAAVDGIVMRAADKRKDHPAFRGFDPDPGEFRGMSLVDLCRDTLERNGIKTQGMDKQKLVGRALTLRGVTGAQTTSDFTVALENVLHKTLLASFMVAPDTWRRFCAVGSVSDFRAHPRYRTGYLGKLDVVNESGEFTNKSVPDATKESITASTKGNILALSRQAIVNDDMGVFSRVATQLGRGAALTVEIDVYDLLKLNGGLGPDMNDGNPLFDASHENLGGGSALSVDGIEENRVVMAMQTDPAGNEFLDIRPAVLVVPIGLGGEARVINDAQFDLDPVDAGTDEGNKFMKPNKVRGLFRDIVDTPRLTGTRRYLFADPAEMPVIEVAFLEGQQEPFMEMQDGWRTDGVEWKVRHDFGVAAIETRGAVTDAGTT